MKSKPLSFREGFMRGVQDHKDRKSCDPQRWVHAWARWFHRFERGYLQGFYS